MRRRETEHPEPRAHERATNWGVTTVFGLVFAGLFGGGIWLLMTLVAPPRYQLLATIIGMLLALGIGALYLAYRRGRAH
jgi:hypothetical protein